ncbi:MAG TPA: hypothetical protein VD770_03175 [Coxiellaceae bacterium]|nr:hypothetical protein [Coxiellaceae bacterium]
MSNTLFQTQALWTRIKNNFDNYRLSVLASLIVATGLLVISLSVSAGDLIKTAGWVVDLIVIPAFIGRLVSASSYLARLKDAWSLRKVTETKEKGYVPVETVETPLSKKVNADRHIGRWERWGTFLGVMLGIAVGISALMLHASMPLFASLHVVAYPLYVGGFIGIFAGLFNRLGIGIDAARAQVGQALPRNKVEISLMIAGAALGFTLGAALLATSSTSLAVVAGVTPFIAGAAFPPVIAALIFVLIAASVYASAADYLGKTVSYARAFFDKDFNHNLKSRIHEHRGSVVGVVLGLGVGVALVLTLPFTGGGLAGVAVGSLIVLTAVGVIGGLVARIARLFDKLGNEKPVSDTVNGHEDANLPISSLENKAMKLSPANKVVASGAPQQSSFLNMFQMSIFGDRASTSMTKANPATHANIPSLQSAS